MTTEAAIRDYLADHLELVEPGLTLVKKEFLLPNPLGAKGFIDILARDQYGLMVVIELKRSDVAARTALNELHKYIALLRSNYGLGKDSVRCIVASTDWHELRVPFSEFCRSAAYSVEGRQIRLDSKGVPVALTPVEPVPSSEPLLICPDHMVFCFRDEGERAQGLLRLGQQMEELRVRDYLVVKLNHKGSRGEGYLSFILYVAVGKVEFETRAEVEHHLSPSAKSLIEEVEEDPQAQWGIENAILSDLAVAVSAGETSASGPDMFVGLLRDWASVGLERSGRFASREIHEDDKLLFQLGGLDGASSIAFLTICSPRHKPSWDSTRDKLRQSLLGNESWLTGVHAFMRKAEADVRSSFSIRVFNPMNLLRVLRDLHVEKDPGVRPSLQVVWQREVPQTPSVLHGELVWDGETHPKDPEGILAEVCEKVFEARDLRAYFVAAAMKEIWMLEAELLARHGLRYALAEYQLVDGKVSAADEIISVGEQVTTRPLTSRFGNLPRFLQANRGYLDAVAEFFARHVIDLT